MVSAYACRARPVKRQTGQTARLSDLIENGRTFGLLPTRHQSRSPGRERRTVATPLVRGEANPWALAVGYACFDFGPTARIGIFACSAL
jgi:hypothetical protein